MARTALVTGATGLLGRQVLLAFQRAGWEAVGTGFSRSSPSIRKLDLGNHSAISTLLDEVKYESRIWHSPTITQTGADLIFAERPQVVVHCAANRFPEKCEADPEGARALNVEATRVLAEATSSRKIHLIYISTDYVFPGTLGEAPYASDAKTSPPNLYGQTKLDGETAILEQNKGTNLGIVLRVPVLYGSAEHSSESAVNILLDKVWQAQGKAAKIEMDDWSQRYPTNTEDVGRVCQDITVRYLESSETERAKLPNILQFSSEDRYTKYEICQLMAEILGLPLDGMVANKQGNTPGAGVQRPCNTHLSTQSLKDIGVPIWTQDFKAWWRREAHAVRH